MRVPRWPIYPALAVLAIALEPAFDALADRSLAWHMAQHLLLMVVAAPLLALGLPRAKTRTLAVAFRRLTHPVFAWIAFIGALYITHFSSLYDAALTDPRIHAVEHGLYLGAGLAFWTALFAQRYPTRIFMLFLAMPMSAFLGFAIYTASRPMYAHYAQVLGAAGALADQRAGGELMWLLGGASMFVALIALAAQWLRHEQRLALIEDRRSI